MRPEYYADLFRRYGSYVRNFSGNQVYKIACGPNSVDYNWTEVLMREAGQFMDALTLHYYTTGTGVWENKGSATEFEEDLWFRTMKNTLVMEELVTKHDEIMTKYDPEKRVALIVDEWGTWFEVEKGTNPGFLYQQNTIRDALVAGINLNIFNEHCDRVKMANIAQTINVLQAVILTEGPKMLLTPTYHVFNMYKVHQDAELLEVGKIAQDYIFGEEKVPQIHSSASVDKDGKIHISICNLDPKASASIECDIEGRDIKTVNGSVLASEKINDHNTFECPDKVKPSEFSDYSLDNNKITLTVPAMSVLVLELQ